jgi:Lipase (class 3)
MLLSNYEWRMVWECALLSKKSYSQKTVTVGSNSFLFSEFGNYKIISFTGSESNLKDWMNDFEVVKVSRDGAGKVHNGFADSFDDLKLHILHYVNKNDKIIFTGHSLGGAIACLASFFFKRNGFNVTCVTFGQPRVGNSDFKDAFNKLGVKMYRFVHGYDIVTTIPRVLYYHVGTLIPIFDGKVLDEQMTFGWNVFSRFWNTASRFEHHEMDNGEKSSYISCISKIIDGMSGKIKEIDPKSVF